MKIRLQLRGEVKGFELSVRLIRRTYAIAASWGGRRQPYMQGWSELRATKARPYGGMHDLADGKPGLRTFGRIVRGIVQSELRLGVFGDEQACS